jgi:hypothetical protein
VCSEAFLMEGIIFQDAGKVIVYSLCKIGNARLNVLFMILSDRPELNLHFAKYDKTPLTGVLYNLFIR